VRDRVRAWVILVGVFLLGSLLAAGGAYFWFKMHPEIRGSHRDGGPPPPRGHRRLPEMLEMTPEQEARFGEIMKESRRQLDALQKEQRSRIEKVLEETNRNVSSILDERQRGMFAEYLEDIRCWRSPGGRERRFGSPRGPDRRVPPMPPPPPGGGTPGA